MRGQLFLALRLSMVGTFLVLEYGVDTACGALMTAAITAASYDVLTGWYNDTNMKCGGSNYSNTTYFNADQIHPIGFGHNDIGSAYDATAIEFVAMNQQVWQSKRIEVPFSSGLTR